MDVVLENDSLLIKISSKGAELTSIFSKATGIEYLWQADPSIWGRHAPVLFPIVGRLKEHQYQIEGKTYQMSQHGFARDMEFNIVSQEGQSGSFLLNENEESLAKFPFPFSFTINYFLKENNLEVQYVVHNPKAEFLPFTLGAHPGFSCPMLTGETIEDYFIQFELAEHASIHLLEDGLFNGATEDFLIHSDRFDLDPHTFDKDALVFKNLQSSWVKMVSSKSGHSVSMTIDDFPYLGIWAKPAAPFVCLEPWLGHADTVDHDGDFLSKAGMISLEKEASFSCSYLLSFD